MISVDRFASLLDGATLQVAVRGTGEAVILKAPGGGTLLRPDSFGRIWLPEISLDPNGTLLLTVECPNGAAYDAESDVPVAADGTAHVLVKPVVRIGHRITTTERDADHANAVMVPFETLSGVIAVQAPTFPSISG